MKKKIKDLIDYLEHLAPPAYQEAYDNCGLLVGKAEEYVQGVLCALDCTPALIHEAVERRCNLVVVHHPIIFNSLKSLSLDNITTRCLTYAIKHDLAIYAIHTNIDQVPAGVNEALANQIGLQKCTFLRPKCDTLSLLTTFVPQEALDSVREAISKIGAGVIDSYTKCSFVADGLGTFQASEGSTPYRGSKNHFNEVAEKRLEMIVPSHLCKRAIGALLERHPYETPVYYIQKLTMEHTSAGTGMVGFLPEALSGPRFLKRLKESLQLKSVRHSVLPPKGRMIQKVAICGGSGASFLKDAIACGADAFVTADVKYHSFFDADGAIFLVDVGHYESEICIKEQLVRLLQPQFPNLPIVACRTNTNPVHYT